MDTDTDRTGLRATALSMLGALGVVYGDIGTSPLYALREASEGLQRSHEVALGLASTFFLALLVVVTIKYIVFIMRADQHGEGGIFALLGLLKNEEDRVTATRLTRLTILITFGAALLYGDGIITPAISVLSAVEGLTFATHAFQPWIVPITVVILLALFSVQWKGTEKVGRAFGYVMCLWFAALVAMAVPWIATHPGVLAALDPRYALRFLGSLTPRGYLVLMGSVTLCITGGEALYADIGHFGRRPVRLAWLIVVFPALTINYMGQAARLLEPGPIPHENVFYAMVPHGLLVPAVLLSTAATVIASQALITGAFSLTSQAMQMGLFPRMTVIHTSDRVGGQIYLPAINALLCAGSVTLVLVFHTSSNLSGAYGLAVSGTMAITTIGFYAVTRYVWKWPAWVSLPLCVALIAADVNFLVANSLKFFVGGYVPCVIAVGLSSVMLTWQIGRKHLRSAYLQCARERTLQFLIDKKRRLLAHGGVIRDARGTFAITDRAMVFLCSTPVRDPSDPLPLLVRLYIKRHGVMPKEIILLHVQQYDVPEMVFRAGQPEDEKPYSIDALAPGIRVLTARYGYRQPPHIGILLDMLASDRTIDVPVHQWTVMVGEEDVVLDDSLTPLGYVVANFFSGLLRHAVPAHFYLGLGKRRNMRVTRVAGAPLEVSPAISKEVFMVHVGAGGIRYELPQMDVARST